MIRFNYIGSKYRVLDFIIPEIIDSKSIVDPFCGTCSVSYEAKKLGLSVISGDNLLYPYNMAKAIIQNNKTTLDDEDVKFLLSFKSTGKAAELYGEIFLSHEVWDVIEGIRTGINYLPPQKQSVAISALCAATVTGHATNGTFTTKTSGDAGHIVITKREEMIKMFNKKISHINKLIIPGNGVAVFGDAIETIKNNSADILYVDPPYVTTKSTTNYRQQYHVLENIINNFNIDINVKSKARLPVNTGTTITKRNVFDFLNRIISSAKNYRKILLSYNSNGIPGVDDITWIFNENGFNVVVKRCEIQYYKTSKRESKGGIELLYVATR